MYNTNNVVQRIKQTLNEKSISVSKMLSDLELGVNALYQFEKGRVMSSFNLAKIADYLECSVDYLLGRVDFPELVIKDEDGNYISKYKKEYTGEEIIKLIERGKNSARAAALGGGKVSVKKELTDDDLKKVMEILNSSEDK